MEKNRRQIISSSLKLALLIIVSACKSAAKKSSASQTNNPVQANSSSSTVNSSATNSSTGSKTTTTTATSSSSSGQDCNGKFDLTTMAKAPEALSVVFKCYGSANSVLLAFILPKFSQNGDLTTYYIVRQSGDPIVSRQCNTTADLQSDGQLKVQFFDHLPITDGTQIAFVFNYKQGFVCSPFVTVACETSFQNLPVIGFRQCATDTQIVTPEIIQNISSDILQSITTDYIAVDSSSTFYATGELVGCLITDLVGEVIREYGDQYADFSKQAIFVVYKKVANSYARTIVKLV